MRRVSLITCLVTAALLGGCSALPFGEKEKTSPTSIAQVLDPGLKIAVDVVMARLRSAEGDNAGIVKDAAPEIYQLAAALMPPANINPVTTQPVRPQSPKRPPTAVDRPGETMHGAQITNVSYTPDDIKQPPELPQARSLMYAVHLGSYRSAARALNGYVQIKTRVPGALAKLAPRVERVDLGPKKGIYERLKAGPLSSRGEAQAVCTQLDLAGLYCATADYTGRTPG